MPMTAPSSVIAAAVAMPPARSGFRSGTVRLSISWLRTWACSRTPALVRLEMVGSTASEVWCRSVCSRSAPIITIRPPNQPPNMTLGSAGLRMAWEGRIWNAGAPSAASRRQSIRPRGGSDTPPTASSSAAGKLRTGESSSAVSKRRTTPSAS